MAILRAIILFDAPSSKQQLRISFRRADKRGAALKAILRKTRDRNRTHGAVWAMSHGQLVTAKKELAAVGLLRWLRPIASQRNQRATTRIIG